MSSRHSSSQERGIRRAYSTWKNREFRRHRNICHAKHRQYASSLLWDAGSLHFSGKAIADLQHKPRRTTREWLQSLSSTTIALTLDFRFWQSTVDLSDERGADQLHQKMGSVSARKIIRVFECQLWQKKRAGILENLSLQFATNQDLQQQSENVRILWSKLFMKWISQPVSSPWIMNRKSPH